MERTPSSASSAPSTESNGLFTPQSDSVSVTSTTVADNQLFQDLAQHVGTIRLSQDVPRQSIEESSTDSSGGAPISRGTTHSRTPSVALTPPPAGSSEVIGPASSIDGRLGMSEVADAIEGIMRGSDGPGVYLRADSPAAGSTNTPRRYSRRRSSSPNNASRHEVTDEELPNELFHTATFQQAFSDAKRLMVELTEVLSSSNVHHEPDSSMRGLCERASELSRFHCPSTRIVGFVGDSGAGKSSLLNSLLDCKDLARTSDGGAACTSVVTEYHYHSIDGFAIEVEWFSRDETEAQLTELLKAYRSYHLRGADVDEREVGDLEKLAEVARDTFRAMFRGRLGDEEFLLQWSESRVMRTFRSWVAEADYSPTGRQTFSSLEDCSAHLMPLTSDQNQSEEPTEEPSKWPYIRKVKVFLKAYILSKGLVLVDLPGLRDLNAARRDITDRYLVEIKDIFAVCPIGRATTDASVMSVFETAAEAEVSHVGIVCTMSAGIQPDEAKRDWGGERANKVQQLQHAIATCQRDILNAQVDVDELSEIDADDMTPEDKDDLINDLHEANKRLKQAKRNLENHSLELKKFLIDNRNSEVTKALKNLYQDKVPGNELTVFCVDNLMYKDHRNDPKDVALPFLHLSGIIPVRKHCISLVASSQLRNAREYIKNDIPALLGDIELWIQSGAGTIDAERKAEIRETVNALEAQLKRNLTGNASQISTITRSMTDMFNEQIYQRRRIAEWKDAASKASNEWRGWHAASYKACCARLGVYGSEAVGGNHNWNERAIQQMVRDLAIPWQELRSMLESSLERDIKFIRDLMDSNMDYAENQLQHSLELADTLGRTMRSRQHLLLADIEKASEDFEDGLDVLRTDAFSSLRTAFIGRLMEESYSRCNRDSGGGSDRRRKDVIGDRLSDQTLFVSLQRGFKSRFIVLAERLQSAVQTAVAKHLSVITNTLDMVRSENVALESERDPEFRGRVERETRTIRREVRRLKSVVCPETTGDGRRVSFEV